MQRYIKLVRYYIYAFLDLDKPGHYITYTDLGKLTFDHEPVYIGKGAGTRMISHVGESHNSELDSFIKNGNYEYTKIFDELPSHTAYKIEGQLIYNIGRKDLGRGPLFNREAGVRLIESVNLDIGPNHLEFNKLIHIIKIMNSTKTLKEAALILGISERSLYRAKKDYRLKKVEGSWIQI